MRLNMLDVMQAIYVETARAKGLSPMRVLFRHIVPNALHPMIMFQGVALPYMIAGELEIAIVLCSANRWPADCASHAGSGCLRRGLFHAHSGYHLGLSAT